MATITAAASGDFGTGATWTGGVAPAAADRAVIPPSIDVTISDARVVQSFEIPDGNGRFLITGSGSLEFSADSHIYGSTSDVTRYRIVMSAGAKLLFNPAAATTVTLRMGGTIHVYPAIEATGTAGAKCYVGKKAGATGTALLRNYDGVSWVAGLTKSVHTRWVGLGTATVEGIVFSNRLHGRIDFEDCTVEGCGLFNLEFFNINDGPWQGACRFVRTHWTGTLAARALSVIGNSTNGWTDVLDCDIDGEAVFIWNPGAGEWPLMLTLTDNWFQGGLDTTLWPADKITSTGNTIGAGGAPSGLPARYTEWLGKVWDIHHTEGTLPYLAITRNAPDEPGYDPGSPENEGYNNNQGEHYDAPANMIHRRDYLTEVGHSVTDWSYEIAAALQNFRENCIRYDAKLSQLQGHHCHSRGLAMHYHETGQEFDRTAIDAMILWNIGYTPEQYRNLNFLERARESAFYLNTSLDRRWVGLVPLDCEGPACDLMLELCEHWSQPREVRPFNGYFVWMSGLCLRSMIRYWEHHRTETDPTIAARVAAIPAAVEAQLDSIQDVGWYPPGVPAIAEGGSTWDKGSVKYLYPDRTEPTYVPITDLVVQTVQSQYVFTGAASLSEIDDYYKGASIRPHGWTIPGGAQLWVSSYEGATRTFTAVAVFTEFTFTPGLVFDLEPVGWNDDIEQRGQAYASPVLNPIVSPAAAFAWWYRKVKLADPAGAARHRIFHHELFDGAYLAWTGAGQNKIHMEGFFWIREGLKWIDLGDAGTDYTLLRTYVLPDPIPITPTPATAFTVDGPASGPAGSPIPFLFTLEAGALASPKTITARQLGAGSFSPPTLDLTDTIRSGTISYTPDAPGAPLIDFVDGVDLSPPLYDNGPEYSNPSFHHFTATPPTEPEPEPPPGTRLLLRRNPTPGAIPVPAALLEGELALNTADGLLYTKLQGGNVTLIGGTGPPVDESNLVHKTGAETIAGAKTFTDLMALSASTLAMPTAFAIGAGAHDTLGIFSTAIGNAASAIGVSGTSFGNSARADGQSATALGQGAWATGLNALAMGYSARATGDYGISLSGTASAVLAMALGRDSAAAHDYSTALGFAATTTETNQIMLGTSSQYVMCPGNVVLAKNSSTQNRKVAQLVQEWVDNTDATRKGRLTLSALDWAAAREGLRLEADGTNPRIGFLGAPARVRPVVDGSRSDGTALFNLIAALHELGLILNNTTP